MNSTEPAERNNKTSPGKSNWYLLTGLIIGFLLGLVISWVASPIKYVETDPSSLRSDYKDEFRSLIASSFFYTRNISRAQARLALLNDNDPLLALTNQAQALIFNGDPSEKAMHLAFLAEEIKRLPSPEGVLSQTSTEPSETQESSRQPERITTSTIPPLLTPQLTPTSEKTKTLTPTPLLQYKLVQKDVICNDPEKSFLLQVEVIDSSGSPMAGIEVIISSALGEEHFFTGLKPAFGEGYADYLMDSGLFYNVQLRLGGEIASDISAPVCSDEGGADTIGSLKLVFQQSARP